jgi:spectrin beta
LIDTRAQILEASRQMHKFFHDCRDCLSRIMEKTHSMPEELGRDSSSVGALSRKHHNFLKDIEAIGTQVRQIEEDAAYLRDSYAGDRAVEIGTREAEVIKAWRQLRAMCEGRTSRLTDTSDLFRFMNMVRDLLLWMDEVKREMTSQERPKDVSGVELLMNNHQSLKAEIDTREENFHECITLGRNLLDRRHYASAEIEKKLIKLTTERAEMMHRWEDRWEYLRLILEVYQFARDAAVAEAWLNAQEPYLLSRNYGRNLEEVIALIKKHEAFEKSAAAQEERFLALEKLTNFELKEMQRRGYQHEEDRRRRAGSPGASRAGPTTTFPVAESGRPEGTQLGDSFEGTLIRKHTMEGLDRPAKNRAWDKLYVVLQNNHLTFYKDQRHRQENVSYHGEQPIDLIGCSATISEYPKRKHVLSLRMPYGSEFLLQANDEEDLNRWLNQLQLSTGQSEASTSEPPRSQSQTLSAEGKETKAKKGGFFSRSKKQ